MTKKFLRSTLFALFLAGPVAISAQTPSSSNAAGEKPLNDLLYEVIEEEGIERAIAKYNDLKANDSGRYRLDGQQLNRLGYRLLNENKNREAFAVFAFNTENHPDNINYWDSLNDGYLAAGDYEKAAEIGKKILEMLKEQELQPRVENLLRSKAEMNLYKVTHFSPPSGETLHYASYYGGNPAGKWDMENVARFNEMHAGMAISYTGYNYYFSPVPNRVDEIFYGGHPADVATGAIGGDFLRYVERGKIAEITGLWDEKGWDSLFPEPFRKMSSHEGRRYFVPMAYQWNPVWYRKDIFEKHGLTPPGSWEELLALCGRLNELGYAPFSISVQNWPPPTARWFSVLNLRLNGAPFHRKVMRGRVPFTDDKIRAVFEHWRELFRHDAFSDTSHTFNYREGIRALTSGEAVMYNLGEWIFESLDEEQGARLDFFAFPPIDPDVPQAEIVHAYGAFMSAKTSQPAKARELLVWLAGAESQAANVRSNSRAVANTQVDPSLFSPVQRRILSHLEEVEEFVPLLELGMHPELARSALEVFQSYWKDPEDIDSAMRRLEESRVKLIQGR